MKKLKNYLTTILIILFIIGLISGIIYIDYNIWRAEHPNAKTWTFFLHKKSN